MRIRPDAETLKAARQQMRGSLLSTILCVLKPFHSTCQFANSYKSIHNC